MSVIIFSCIHEEKNEVIFAINNPNKEIKPLVLDDFLITVMDSLKIPGISLAIINNSKIVYHRAIGVSNIETNEHITDNSIFEAASITKPLIAYFTLKMAEKSILDIERPLFFYLPDGDMEVDPRYKQVSAETVLSHKTGFPNWRWFDPIPEDLDINRGDFYMKTDPGTFTYSGEGYQYLTRVLAHNNFVNMYELSKLIKNEVSNPLHMKHAYFVWDDFLIDNKVYGHRKDKLDTRDWGSGLPHQHSKIVNGAGGLHTESVSYANFLIGLIKEKGLSKKSFKKMFSEISILPNDHRYRINENTRAWSLGLAIEDYNGSTFYKHGGNNGGFNSGFLISKEYNTGYVFFINCDKGAAFEKELRKILID